MGEVCHINVQSPNLKKRNKRLERYNLCREYAHAYHYYLKWLNEYKADDESNTIFKDPTIVKLFVDGILITDKHKWFREKDRPDLLEVLYNLKIKQRLVFYGYMNQFVTMFVDFKLKTHKKSKKQIAKWISNNFDYEKPDTGEVKNMTYLNAYKILTSPERQAEDERIDVRSIL